VKIRDPDEHNDKSLIHSCCLNRYCMRSLRRLTMLIATDPFMAVRMGKSGSPTAPARNDRANR
jgi:hypothetical protein